MTQQQQNVNSPAQAKTATVVQVRTVADLRAHEPAAAGELATVLEYNPGSKMGGGVFVYDITDTKSPDDGGVTFVSAKGARWKRVLQDYNNVTVLDFGAIADGKTDCAEAVRRMFNWSQKNYPATGIRFTAGEFYLSAFDIADKGEVNRFKVSGAPVNFGYFPTTLIYSDRKNSDVVFRVKARYVEIAGLVFAGQSNVDGHPANTKGFFKNVVTGGQFLHVSSVEFRNTGGRCLDLIDTLDCKIDQFYSRHSQDSIIYARWSDQAQGAWDHCTAIELSNFNIQNSKNRPALDLPRCTQSFIRNGWIEHTDYPGDLTNGQWVIEGLAIESSIYPLKLGFTRALIIQKSIHSSAKPFDYSTDGIEPWTLLSEFDRGVAEISDLGAIFQGSLSYDAITSQHHMSNFANAHTWFYVGEFHFSDKSSQIHLRMLGSAQYLSQGATQTDFSTRTPEGVAHIYLQAREESDVIASWYGEGSSPVGRVHIEGTSARCKLYVKIPPSTGWTSALVDTNGRDRYQAGISFKFRKSFTQCSTEEAQRLDAAPTKAFQQHWTGNDKVGFGYNDNNQLILRGPYFEKAYQREDQSWYTRRFARVMYNGKPFSIELLPEDGI
ncbi:hypothetical protein [Pantoea sp. A4]|uniref:hypothetical protein n=1 Tax=Pantoea sp. A4 TaxID=1225184 RepID=UPI00038102BB|nr:hypothetical protein [Pantoea sp. A4]